MAKRPGSVTFVAVLAYINGALSIIGGVVTLFTRDQMVRPGASTTGLTTSAILSIILGIVVLVVARGLLDGSRTARTLVVIVEIIAVLNGILLMLTLQFVSGAITVLWAILIMSLLFTRRANAFFDGRQTA